MISVSFVVKTSSCSKESENFFANNIEFVNAKISCPNELRLPYYTQIKTQMDYLKYPSVFISHYPNIISSFNLLCIQKCIYLNIFITPVSLRCLSSDIVIGNPNNPIIPKRFAPTNILINVITG